MFHSMLSALDLDKHIKILSNEQEEEENISKSSSLEMISTSLIQHQIFGKM